MSDHIERSCTQSTVHIDLWSGLRCGADEMCGAWEQRGDCAVGDSAQGLPIWLQRRELDHRYPFFGWDRGGVQHHLLLIRDPREVLAELPAASLSAEDLGLPQLNRVFERLADRSGHAPTIIDHAALRADPEAQLRLLCAHWRIEFSVAMLPWPAARRSSAAASRESVRLAAECERMYRRLYEYRLQPDSVRA